MPRTSPSSFPVRSTLIAGAALGVVLVVAALGPEREQEAGESEDPGSLNVLLLSIDDLGCQLGCYGVEHASTPNIDRIAEAGLLFEASYCQSAICNPSRASMLTGCRPQTHGVHDLRTSYRKALPDHVVLPELFRRNGWTTRALGKIHHGDGKLDDEQAWSEGCWRPERWQRYYAKPRSQELVRKRLEEEKDDPRYVGRVFAWERPEVEDGELPDGLIAEEAIEFLREDREEPFFLAVGFLKPHLPFVAPARYWALHPDEATELCPFGDSPAGAPSLAVHDSPELRSYENVPDEGPLREAMQRRLLRGYRACTSFVDAQIGRILEVLEAEGLARNTIVVVWGDHGWHLGDLGMWGKHTNYENAVRSPLIVSVPGMNKAGERSDRLVESVDLYPTLAELCGLEPPAELEGISLVPLLEDPGREWKQAVFNEYARQAKGVGQVLGRSMRTPTHRIVEWARPQREFLAIEVYEYGGAAVEQINLAAGEEHQELVSALLEQLHAGWRGALPVEKQKDGAR